MIIKNSEFITSATRKEQYPQDNLVEIAFVGRSNVGKSSIINAITNRRNLARVSGTPGRTRLVNFFLINKEFYLVDLPGYGYAKVSKSEKQNWGNIIETYLKDRPQLKRVVLLVDCRHKPTEDDILMYQWIKYYGYDVVVVGTKRDKISNNQLKASEKVIKETLKLSDEDLLTFYSSLNKKGTEELNSIIFKGYYIED
ncbi:ribosome biogenesis GTP-binding protein YihA/YsxC [Desnuesiella massiliensis]|uniref:ribosome biogenesis GTP-binding protein YihA/YsxC n=1 Tax=Desnuesiella massiliensis TaxID=1650662 RepID=UPI0006E39F33|nr:ribosome biogenesis GTP-binding protein YihA/YsxC [Desnuesiella massiliensis]